MEIEKTLSHEKEWTKIQELEKEKAPIIKKLEMIEKWEKDINNLEEIYKIACDEEEKSTIKEIKDELKEIEQDIEKKSKEFLLGEKDDKRNAIVTIHAGAGGLEACDWTGMLFRMYSMWAEKNNFKTDIVDKLIEEAGFKYIVFIVKGLYAYGYLKGECGVHRLVRISPFDASKKRHTSFASVSIIPEIEDSVKIDIKESDMRIDTFRASGHGGQHVNKTDSAIRITHIPTGIVVTCQNERSQYKNKNTALHILKAKLYKIEMEKKEEEKKEVSKQKKNIEWSSQIRSYVLQPYKMVKNHRTNLTVTNTKVDGVLNGEIERFIEENLRYKDGR
jgi:peptide chain release factor 2